MFAGIDFGTTNSAIGLLDSSGDVRVVSHPHPTGLSDTLRSILAFDRHHCDAAGRPRPLVGHEAIATYLEGDGDCRLLQSFKSYLTSRIFSSATIFNRTYTLEQMIALVVERLRQAAEAAGGAAIRRVVAGRPVRFVAEDGKIEDDYALTRLRQAFAIAGIDEVAFEYEPIAAAYYYERGLDRDETVLVADFGGGTSDFSLVRLGPGRARLNRPEDAIIGTGGVGLAGDSFDRRIVECGIAEFFGKNTEFRSGDKALPVPDWLYGKFSRWHHIAFLGTGSTLRMLRDIQRHADHPERIEDLLTLIEHNLGYHLYRAVEAVKLALSQAESTTFAFDYDSIHIERPITRAEFENWIAPDLAKIEDCVETLLQTTQTPADRIDRVFLTGGSSLVPSVRRIFARRFGQERLSGGGEFVSVASGLAYRAEEIFAAG
ncbi:MAG: Hsp70 family protein [Magnetospirillum sp.]